MRIKQIAHENTNQKIEKVETRAIDARDEQAVDIYCWRDGGAADFIFAYVTLRSIKELMPNGNIIFLVPHYNMASQLLGHQKFFTLRYASYAEIHKRQNAWHGHDYWISLRPKTFSVIADKLKSNERLADSCSKQIALFGEDYFKDPWGRVESQPVYGNGQLYATDVYNYIHNINADFKHSRECIVSNPGFQQWTEHLKDDYITIHQWAYIDRSGVNMKFWPHHYWQELVRLIKRNYGIRVIQIGNSNEHVLSQDAENFLGKYPFIGSMAFMNGSRLHIDIEGSLVHVCCALEHPCISIVGPSSKYWRHDSENVSYILPKDNVCQHMPCEDSIGGWHNHCHAGTQACMNAILPEVVFEEVKKKLN